MKVNPLFALLVNLLIPRQEEGAERREGPELGDLRTIATLRRKLGSVTIIIGRRESGKSVVGYRLAELLDRPIYAVSPEAPVPHGVTELSLEELDDMPPPGSTLFLDDIPVYASQRDYGVAAVRVLEKLIPVVRHKRKLHIISATQSSGLTDRFVMDADIVLLKPANLLFSDLERTSVARLYRTVQPLFDQMSPPECQRHIYLLSQNERRMVRVNLPSFMTR